MKDISLADDEKQDLLKKINNCGLAQTMGIEVYDLDHGYAKSRLKVEKKHLNVLDILHGAAVLCLADYTAGAARTTLGVDVVALQINSNFTGAIIGIGLEETIYCEARSVVEDQRIIYQEIMVNDGNGHLITMITVTGIKPVN